MVSSGLFHPLWDRKTCVGCIPSFQNAYIFAHSCNFSTTPHSLKHKQPGKTGSSKAVGVRYLDSVFFNVTWIGCLEGICRRDMCTNDMCYCIKVNDKYNQVQHSHWLISYPKKDIVKTHMDLSEVHEQVKSASGCSVFHVRFLCRTGSCQSPLAESKKVEEEDSLSNSSASDAEE